MKKALFLSTLLLSAGSVYAVEAPQWDKVTIEYGDRDYDYENDNADLALDGLYFHGTKLVTDNIFIEGGYEKLSGEATSASFKYDVDYSIINVGVGYRYAINDFTDVFATLGGMRTKYEISTVTIDDDIYYIGAGVRSLVKPNIELELYVKSIAHTLKTEIDTALLASYHFTDNISAGVGVHFTDNYDSTVIKASFAF